MFRAAILRQRWPGPLIPSAARKSRVCGSKCGYSTGRNDTQHPTRSNSASPELASGDSLAPSPSAPEAVKDSVGVDARSEKESFSDIVKRRGGSISVSALAMLDRLGVQLNKVTGYEEIEALKRDVVQQGASYATVSFLNPDLLISLRDIDCRSAQRSETDETCTC